MHFYNNFEEHFIYRRINLVSEEIEFEKPVIKYRMILNGSNPLRIGQFSRKYKFHYFRCSRTIVAEYNYFSVQRSYSEIISLSLRYLFHANVSQEKLSERLYSSLNFEIKLLNRTSHASSVMIENGSTSLFFAITSYRESVCVYLYAFGEPMHLECIY